MNAIENRQIVVDFMHALARGDSRPIVEAMHEDMTLRHMADSRRGTWTGTYSGKAEALGFFRRWHSQLDGPLLNQPVNIFADGDHVVVESKGKATMKSGEAYNQNYCMVLRMSGGKIMEMREYFDSALADALFEKV